MTGWASRYVGIPHVEMGRDFTGADCYGLGRLILREECSIEVPSFTESYVGDAERVELASLILDGAQVGPWHRVEDIRPFDWLLFRMAGHASHIGVAIDARRMIHSHSDVAKIARLSDPSWACRRVGAWRHEELMT
ncbi:NlpC/P60 family protein [Sagittula sp. S175]|uniref:NlpC/P60 family protein n=1 Tax=Sagittula sp. S175 TaxID=3415129 RepID=UPI003C7D2771